MLAETEARKRRAHVEPAQQEVAAASNVFALDQDDEDDEYVEEAEGDADFKDLEFTYEGLELSGLMSLERAMQLAQCGEEGALQGTDAELPAERHAAAADSVDAVAAPASSEASNIADYEAPLRVLELALAKMRGSSAGSSRTAAVAGTGEAGDLTMYDEQLDRLQEALGRMNAAAVAQHADVHERTEANEANHTSSSAEDGLVAPTATIAPVAATSTTQREKPQSKPQPEPAAQHPAAAVTGFGLFSPYAMLGKKYSQPAQ